MNLHSFTIFFQTNPNFFLIWRLKKDLNQIFIRKKPTYGKLFQLYSDKFP